MREIANTVENEYPEVAYAINNCFYVDDYTGGAYTVESAVQLYKEMKSVFASFGFNLRKFMNNSSEFLEHVAESGEMAITKALGILWQPQTDEFMFSFRLDMNSNPKTKTDLFSEIAKLYNPMGWLAPFIIKAKILTQSAWSLSKSDKKNYIGMMFCQPIS